MAQFMKHEIIGASMNREEYNPTIPMRMPSWLKTKGE